MAIPGGLLSEMADLRGPVGEIRGSIDQLLDRDGESQWQGSVGEGITNVESSVETWIRVSGDYERRLLEYGAEVPEDLDDVQYRIGGFMMLHLAIATDVAKLVSFDEAPEESRVSEIHFAAESLGVELPRRANSIGRAALAPGGLLEIISTPAEELEPDEGMEDVDNENWVPDQSSPRLPDVAKEDLDEMVGDVIDEVVTDIVERSARAGTAVLFGLAGGVDHALAGLVPHLVSALNAVPDDVRNLVVRTIKRIARLVKILVARARAALDSVLVGYRAAVAGALNAADPGSLVSESLSGHIMGRIVHSKEVRRVARERLNATYRKKNRIQRIRALKKTHRNCVGPVRIIARGLHYLWAVPLGPVPVPAAPVAAVALLGWTVLITGDQLDSPGPFPNLWKGVVRRASGE
jgi:hypothetical protein